MNSDDEILNNYKSMVNFIADLSGPACEVLLHDTRNPKKSVVAIANGHLSGRGLGSPLTDFAKRIIASKIYENIDYMVNYNGSSKGHDFLSSTYFIKNPAGELIGMLCINKDLSTISEMNDMIKLVEKQYNLKNVQSTVKEQLDAPADQYLHDSIAEVIQSTGHDPLHMKTREKAALACTLKDKGLLNIKGGIKEAAIQLFVSEPTIYRYISSKREL